MKRDAEMYAVIRGQLTLLMEHVDCAVHDANREAKDTGREVPDEVPDELTDEAMLALFRWKRLLLRWRRELDYMFPPCVSR